MRHQAVPSGTRRNKTERHPLHSGRANVHVSRNSLPRLRIVALRKHPKKNSRRYKRYQPVQAVYKTDNPAISACPGRPGIPTLSASNGERDGVRCRIQPSARRFPIVTHSRCNHFSIVKEQRAPQMRDPRTDQRALSSIFHHRSTKSPPCQQPITFSISKADHCNPALQELKDQGRPRHLLARYSDLAEQR